MKKIFAFFISISIIFFILLYLLDFIAKDISYYNTFHDEHRIYQSSGLSKEWISEASFSLVEFIKSGNEDVLKKNFNQKEILHMRDVYKLFRLNRVIYSTLFIILFNSIVYKLLKKDFSFFKLLSKFLLISYIFIIMFFSICSLFFSKSFIYFHKLFFSNDLWLLNYDTDFMIRILPEKFFYNLFLNVLIIFSLFIIIIYFFLKSIKGNDWE